MSYNEEDIHPFLNPSNFISWLETKNPDEVYDYIDARKCLIAQFLKSQCNYSFILVSENEFWLKESNKYYRLPFEWNEISRSGTKTFGAALERAKETFHLTLA